MTSSLEDHFSNITAIVQKVREDQPQAREWAAQEMHQLLEEMIKALNNLEICDANLKEENKIAKEKLSCLEKERVSAKKEFDKLQTDFEVVTKKVLKYKIEDRNSKYSIVKVKEAMKLSSKDKANLEKQQKELSAYRLMTGIRWDLTVPNHIAAGLHTNDVTKAVKVFEYDKNLNPHITKDLWDMVRKCATQGWQIDKENVPNKV